MHFGHQTKPQKWDTILLRLLSINWGRKWLVDFNAGKAKLILCDWSNDTDAIDVKMDRPVLAKKILFYNAGVVFLF